MILTHFSSSSSPVYFFFHPNDYQRDKMSTITTKLLHLPSTPSFSFIYLDHQKSNHYKRNQSSTLFFDLVNYHQCFNDFHLKNYSNEIFFYFLFYFNRLFLVKASTAILVKSNHSLIKLIILLKIHHLIVQKSFLKHHQLHLVKLHHHHFHPHLDTQ